MKKNYGNMQQDGWISQTHYFMKAGRHRRVHDNIPSNGAYVLPRGEGILTESGAAGAFGGTGNVVYADLDSGYTGIFIDTILWSCVLG